MCEDKVAEAASNPPPTSHLSLPAQQHASLSGAGDLSPISTDSGVVEMHTNGVTALSASSSSPASSEEESSASSSGAVSPTAASPPPPNVNDDHRHRHHQTIISTNGKSSVDNLMTTLPSTLESVAENLASAATACKEVATLTTPIGGEGTAPSVGITIDDGTTKCVIDADDILLIQDTSFVVKIIAPGCEPFDLQVSSVELVQEIHQCLMDREETCHRTCFSLQLNGQSLDNFAELKNVEGLKDGSVLKVVEEPYTVREARIHLRHVRDLLKSLDPADAYNGNDCASLSFLISITNGNLVPTTKRLRPDTVVDCTPPDYIMPSSKERPLTPMLPIGKDAITVQCLKVLSISGWNPPPGYRKMHGDLLYLYCLTLEDKRYHITCCTKGFYVNLSTEEEFNPKPASQKAVYHSLVELLNHVSPAFKKNFAIVQKKRCIRHPFERMATPYQVHTWIAPQFEHSMDFVRAEDAFSFKLGYEEHIPGQTREWNEELQTTRELPRKTIPERLLRERAIFKVHSDFISAATRGAVAVIDGNVMAINPGEESKMQMYIWNNIFFSLGFDVKDHYKDFGGDAAAHVAPINDLQGVRAYFNLDPEGLYVLGTAVVDYRGYRITAQSIIPGMFGILERDQEQSVVYGSIDFGKTIVSCEKYLQLLEKPAAQLKILPHTVKSEKGDAVKLVTSVESKGIVGNDSRHYILDLLRTFPPDVNYLADAEVTDVCKQNGYPRQHPHKLACLRQELIDAFVESRYMTFHQIAAYHLRKLRLQQMIEVSGEPCGTSNSAESAETPAPCAESNNGVSVEIAPATSEDIADEIRRKIAPRGASVEKEKDLPPADEAQRIVESFTGGGSMHDATKEIIRKAAHAAGSLSDTEFYMRFNPDCCCSTVRHGDEEDLEKQRKLVREAAQFVLSSQIPGFIRDCLDHTVTPMDGSTLVEAMHGRGINVRYLGKIVQCVDTLPMLDYVKTIGLCELVCRTAKHLKRVYLQSVEQSHLAAAIAHFLNCFVGSCPQPQPPQCEDLLLRKKLKKRTRISRSVSGADATEWTLLTPKSLWQQIQKETEEYFAFPLDADGPEALQDTHGVQRLSMLRRLCTICGVQIHLRDYAFENRTKGPFSEEDIINVFPITKHINPRASDAYGFYTTGQAKIQQGQLRTGYDLVSEAHNLLNNVYGALHPEIAQCLRLMARLSYILGDHAEALQQQQKAVLISERCCGVDHPNTILEYTHLALYCFANWQVTTALKLLYRARYLLLVSHGENHPHMALLDSNIGLILHAVAEYELSLRFLEHALQLNIHYFGRQNLKVALSYHLIARTQSCRGDFRTALQYEKETFTIYRTVLGDEHEKTKESSDCLKHLTQQAVTLQKRMNEITRNSGSVSQLLPLQVQQPSIASVLEVLNIINGIVFIQISAQEVAALRAEIERNNNDESADLASKSATIVAVDEPTKEQPLTATPDTGVSSLSGDQSPPATSDGSVSR